MTGSSDGGNVARPPMGSIEVQFDYGCRSTDSIRWMAPHPLPYQKKCYFEIEICKIPSDSTNHLDVGFGISARPFKKDMLPGDYDSSYLFYDDGVVHKCGEVFSSLADSNGQVGFWANDVVGCLIDRLQGRIRWYKNGRNTSVTDYRCDEVKVKETKKLGSGSHGLHNDVMQHEKDSEDLLWLANPTMFPVIYASHPCSIKVNFGKEPFVLEAGKAKIPGDVIHPFGDQETFLKEAIADAQYQRGIIESPQDSEEQSVDSAEVTPFKFDEDGNAYDIRIQPAGDMHHAQKRYMEMRRHILEDVG